uniref:Myomesin 1 n=1 Tax=Sphenodon punctatus TaxID=8508 RepID=A0A8D0GZ81_SPHPU
AAQKLGRGCLRVTLKERICATELSPLLVCMTSSLLPSLELSFSVIGGKSWIHGPDPGTGRGLKAYRGMIEDQSYKMSPRAKRAKQSLLLEEKENTATDYVVPVFTGRQVHVSGITDTEEERIKESAAYVARRNLFATGEGISVTKKHTSSLAEEQYEKKTRKLAIRESAERLALRKTLEETEEFHRKLNKDQLLHAPEFVIKPRSHTIWEKQNVKFHCTVTGWPEPRVTWYKNHVPINVHTHPGKYVIESRYGMHSLEINKCDFEDTAQYRASAMNVKGELSAYASLVVKSRFAGNISFEFSLRAATWSSLHNFVRHYKLHVFKSVEAAFGRRVLQAVCEVGTTRWSQCNETPVKFARFPVTGLIEGRSYIFRVRAVNNAGISIPSRVSEPVAALDPADRARLRSHPSAPWTGQIIVTEEEPAVSFLYFYTLNNFVVKVFCTENWQRVNTEIPVKSPRFALFDLAEGKSYHFRVRCCNSAGVGEPSEATEATVVGDKLDIPKAPGRILPTRNTDTSVVVTWEESKDAKELVGYYIETSLVGSGHWEPCNNNPVKGTRFICHGLLTDEHYIFRVRAVNAAGLSEYSQESEAIEVKAAIGGGLLHSAPSPPYDIAVLESVRGSMVLGWKQPKTIGGSEIIGYYVNYREVTDGVPGKWKEANIKSVSERAYRVHDLKENLVYQFQVAAANLAGVGITSPASKSFKCEEWTIAVPGPPHDLSYTEVRKNSLVLLWKPPVYTGRSPVTGFYVDVKETDATDEHWKSVNEKAIANKFLKITSLKEGTSYIFRVRAVNQAGVGKPSNSTDAVIAETRPGTKEMVVDVDDDGVISLNFGCDEMSANSKFIWSKDYEPIDDESRLAIDSKGGKSKAIFKEPGEDDLGIYSCSVTDTDGVSSSYTIDEEGKDKVFIPLKSELEVEILEKGQVRFWLQADKLSANAKSNFVFNDKEIVNGEKYKMKIDRNTGLVEMIMDRLEDEDEGTYTFQLQDGKATNQSSLVLIGDVFKKLQNEAEFQRQEWFRKQGPHFVEYLGWEVTPECNVLLKCKVANIKKETHIVWYKDERDIMVDEKHDFKDGVCTLLITEVSNTFPLDSMDFVSTAFADLMTEVCRQIAVSATELKIQSTEEGIRLYSFVNYYLEDLRVSWSHNAAKIKYTERVKTGVTGEQIWLQINEPTPQDKGKYEMELFDGKTGHTKMLDLSGQSFDEAFAEFQRLKCKKYSLLFVNLLVYFLQALNLTCNVWGEPVPEITWLKNEKSLVGDDHCILKFESGKYAKFTITAVNTIDSGKYSLVVKNKYGTETSDFTVSVFIPEGEGEGIATPQPTKVDKKKKKKKKKKKLDF